MNTAQFIYENAPLGSIIAYSHGKPHNGSGLLVQKTPSRGSLPASFLLKERTTGIVEICRSYPVNTPLTFRIVSRPSPGTVLIIECTGELIHAAANLEAARTWLAARGHSGARLETVTA